MSSNQINIHDQRINPVDRVFGYNKLRKAILHFNFRKVGSFDELTELGRFYYVKINEKEKFINHYLYNQLVEFMKLQQEANKFNAFKKTLKRGELVPTCSIGHKSQILNQCGFRVWGRSLKTRVRDIALLKSMPRHNESRSKKIKKCHKALERSFKHMYVETMARCPVPDYIISFVDDDGYGFSFEHAAEGFVWPGWCLARIYDVRCTGSHCY